MDQGVRNVLNLFHNTAKTCPAYRDFLKKHNVREKTIKTLEDFKQLVPISDKKNYIHHYSLFERVVTLTNRTRPVIHASSGSSGVPTYWFNGDEHERRSGSIHEKIFHEIFGIEKNEPTLVIVCFAMGLWIAGPHSAAASREVARRGYQVTVATPGYTLSDVMGILEHVAPLYRHLIMFGHPARLMDIAQEWVKRGLRQKHHKIHLMYSGDKVTEQWRDDIAHVLEIPDPQRSILGIYGSTDAGAMGHETPFSIFVRRKALEDPRLREQLFGSGELLPALYQFHPEHGCYFESVKGELVLTANLASPLVRYNIHDRGSVISFEQMQKIMKEFGLAGEVKRLRLDRWKLPFVTMGGRSDVATRFYAVAIYPEHVSAAFQEKAVAGKFTGNFFAYITHSKGSRKQFLHVDCELKKGIKLSQRLKNVVRQAIVKNLTRMSLEYRKLGEVLGNGALPFVHLVPFGRPQLYAKHISGLLQLAGKKAQMIKA